MGIIHNSFLESGRELKELGILNEPEDIFFLDLKELERLSRGEKEDWKKMVADHRQTHEREKMRRQIPSILFSDGRAFYSAPGAGIAEGKGRLAGSPVSPGVVEGWVRVVFSPHETTLQPGEILVCPGTDPAWTPLFLAAGGLVMEVGGMMTHGAVVARIRYSGSGGGCRCHDQSADRSGVRVDGGAGSLRCWGTTHLIRG